METNLIRPIGFDGTMNLVPIASLDLSVLFDKVTLTSTAGSSVPRLKLEKTETLQLLPEEAVIVPLDLKTNKPEKKRARIYASFLSVIILLIVVCAGLYLFAFNNNQSNLIDSSNGTKSSNGILLVINSNQTENLPIDTVVNLLNTALKDPQLIYKLKKKSIRDHVQIPNDYLFMVDEIPNGQWDILKGIGPSMESLPLTTRNLLKKYDHYFRDALENFHAKCGHLIWRVNELMSMLNSKEADYSIISLIKDLEQIIQLKIELGKSYFYQFWFKVIVLKENEHQYFLLSKRKELLLLRFDFEFSRESLKTGKQRFPILNKDLQETKNIHLNGFHIDLIMIMLKEKIRQINEKRASPSPILKKALEQIIDKSKWFPFLHYQFTGMAYYDLHYDQAFQNSALTRSTPDVLNSYEKLRMAFSKFFNWMSGFNETKESVPVFYLKGLKEDLEKDLECPNYFCFRTLYTDSSVFLLDSIKHNEEVLTANKSLFVTKRVVKADNIVGPYLGFRFRIIRTNDLIEKLDSFLVKTS